MNADKCLHQPKIASGGGVARPLLAFFISTYLITWGLAVVVMLMPGPIEALLGPINKYNPLFYIAVYAPTISAVVIITRGHGWRRLGGFATGILPSKGAWVWVPLTIGLLALVVGVARLVTGLFTGEMAPPTHTGGALLLMALFFLVADAGPIGEEIGWSGFAYPLLQRRFSPFRSSLILGTIWVFWHLPQFAIAGLGKDSGGFLADFAGFFFVLVSLRILIGVLLNRCRGAIIVAILCHWMHNLSDPDYLGILGNSRISGIALGILYLASALAISKLVQSTPFTDPVP